MSGRTDDSPPGERQDLLALALSRPQDAVLAARSVLAGSRPDPFDASIACQAIGIVLRDRGEVAVAISELRRGLVFAKASGSLERQADVRATLGTALVWIGRTRQGLAQLNTAAEGAQGALAGRILLRRASVLMSLGQFAATLEDLGVALPLLRRAGEHVWEARALVVRAHVTLLYGAPSRARADIVLAEKLFGRAGQELEYAMARHNRSLVAIAQGDLPAALTYLDEAAQLYAALNVTIPDLAIDRSAVLLAAGLATEALTEADDAVTQMHTVHGPAYKRAELLHAAAAAALAIPDPQAAIDRAQHARRLFRAQRRDLWQARSELLLAHGRYADGTRSRQLLREAGKLAWRLDELDPERAQQAHLLAGRLARDLGHRNDVDTHLGLVARVRRGAPALIRGLGWLARALQAEMNEDTRAVRSACRHGLTALDEHRLTLGSTELRAYATTYGAELAEIAQRQALRTGDPRRLLAASERWRATAMASPAARRYDDSLTVPLSALRAIVRQVEVSRSDGTATASLERERRRLETLIREHSRRKPGDTEGSDGRFNQAELTEILAGSRLIELLEVDGTVQVLTLVGNRVRRYACGPMPNRLAEHARFLLRRSAQPQPGAELHGLLDELGRRLQAALLGPAVADLGRDEPLIMIPPASLHAVPWTLMPALRYRVLSVVPSAASVVQVLRLPVPPKHVTFVVGPGLTGGAGEVEQLAKQYPGATVLGHGTATADRVLQALDGSWLAHIAAHGSFRSDNPLFSALELDDGPLTVHDFERLNQAPYRLILPSCDSGIGAPVGADELLGLVSSLVPLGSAGILAALVPINDEATVPVMVALHAALRSGAGLPQALLMARTEVAADPLAAATGYSFTAFGI